MDFLDRLQLVSDILQIGNAAKQLGGVDPLVELVREIVASETAGLALDWSAAVETAAAESLSGGEE